LAMGKSFRADSDRELVRFESLKDDLPYARVHANVHKSGGPLDIDLVIHPAGSLATDSNLGSDRTEASISFQKRIRVNGLPRRFSDYLGQVNVVLFSPEDIQQISGPPSLRRQYLDAVLCQLDSKYLHNLQRYNQILAQRNHLLRLLQEGRASAEELVFWSDQLVSFGSYLVLARLQLVEALNRLAPPLHEAITESRERLELALIHNLGHLEEPSLNAISQSFREGLQEAKRQEMERGVSLVGPHRDDLRLLINGADAGAYGSRGQHRTIIISLRLAQAQLHRSRTGEDPVLLLDDILSELDSSRRQYLLSSIQPYQQVFLTTTDPERASAWNLIRATMFQVKQGALYAMEGSSI